MILVMDQLIIPDVTQLKRALELLWNMKVAEGEALLAQNVDRHPAFAVFQSEVYRARTSGSRERERERERESD